MLDTFRSLVTLLLLVAFTNAQDFKYGHAKSTCPEASVSNVKESYLSDFLKGKDLSTALIIKCGDRVIVDKSATFDFPKGLIVDGEL